MNQLFRAALVIGLVWTGISSFRSLINKIEEEELARLGAGESDFQRHHLMEVGNHRHQSKRSWDD